MWFACRTAIVFMASLAPSGGVATERWVETFGEDPGWHGINHVPPPEACADITQGFGWIPPVAINGEPGAIGGLISRSITPASYGRPVGPFTLDDRLEASGRLRVTASSGGSGALFGWFHTSARGWRTPNSLVVRLDGDANAFRVFFEYGTRNWLTGGGQAFEGRYQDHRDQVHPADGTPHSWRLVYDPEGADGLGEMAFFLDGAGYRTALAPGHRADGAEFDRFGLLNIQLTGKALTLFMDELVVNGEPQALDAEPDWHGVNNRLTYQECIRRPFHDFGWRPTARAGGDPGEIGGIVWRIEGNQTEGSLVYGRPVKPVSLLSPFSVSGKIAFTAASSDSAVLIGWYRHADAIGAPPPGFAGVLLEGPSRIGHYFRPLLSIPDAPMLLPPEGPILRPDARPHEWSCRYEPPANGHPGQLTVTLDGAEGAMHIPADLPDDAPLFDRFGILSWAHGGHFVEFFLDDIEFSTEDGGARPD